MFSVGEKIVYPMHGAGMIRSIEDITILGEKKRYYIFQLPYSEIDVMIPVDSENVVGLRPVADKAAILAVSDFLRAESTDMDSNWNRRYRDNVEKLKSGDIFKVAEVVRNLMRMDEKRSLSAGERKLLNNARQILESEIILSADMTPDEAADLVERSVQLC